MLGEPGIGLTENANKSNSSFLGDRNVAVRARRRAGGKRT